LPQSHHLRFGIAEGCLGGFTDGLFREEFRQVFVLLLLEVGVGEGGLGNGGLQLGGEFGELVGFGQGGL
jgi:hypothetical protein